MRKITCFLYIGLSILLGACAPSAQDRPTEEVLLLSEETAVFIPTITASEISATAPAQPSTTHIPHTETPVSTSTEIPTSAAPSEPPTIIAPTDGAIVQGSMPDFRFNSPARAWSVHVTIFNDFGYRQSLIFGVGGPLGGLMNDMYTPATPIPLANGTYQWFAAGCRETAVGGCGPRSETYSFTIEN